MNPSKKILAIIGLAFVGLILSLFVLKISIQYHDGVIRNFFLDATMRDSVNYHFLLDLKADTLFESSSLPAGVEADTIAHDVLEMATKHIIIEKAEFTFNRNPTLLVWMLSFSMMLAIAFGLILPLFDTLTKIKAKFLQHHSVGWIVGISIVVCAIVIFLGSGSLIHILTAFEIARHFKVVFCNTLGPKAIVILTMLIGGVAIFGILLVNKCIPELQKLAGNDQKKAIAMYDELGNSLRFFLTVLSLLVMFSVFNTTLLQQALTNEISIDGIKKFKIFPTEFIYAYGLIFTIILAIIYLPVDYHLRLTGKALSKTFPPDQRAEAKSGSLFGTQESGLKNLNIFLTLLSPILGSAFSEVIKHLSS